LEIVPEVLSMCHIFSNDFPSIRETKQEILWRGARLRIKKRTSKYG
jgi:hypothetical protein